MEGKSRILIIGATGNLGFELGKASLNSGHPTFALVRDSSLSHPEKSQKLQLLAKSGASLLNGSLEDMPSLSEALKQVDVVICAVSSNQVLHQKILIQAIKQSGCIKRFIPSEFGSDPDKVHISNMDHGFYSSKAEIRRSIEAEGIPHTFISCNFFTSYFLPSLVQPGLKSPPRDIVRIFGDGNTKAVFMKETDVATFTISTVDDPRSLNKTLYLRPVGNVYSMNELVSIWETKIGKKLEKVYIPEEHVLKTIQDTNYPDNMEMVFIYSAFIKGDHTYFDIESSGVDGTKLYPHVKYTTIKTSKILIIGGTGYIGKFIVEASLKSGNPTFLLVREATVKDPVKGKLVESFKNSGATVLYGDLYDHGSLMTAVKQVDVRFFPSEFGSDVDRSRAVEPAKSSFEDKVHVRRVIEAEGIPYTYVASNCFAGYFLPNFSQPGATPPRDKVIILGDGNPRAVFNREEDIATFTIKAVNDPRTLNKILYIKPPINTLSFNDLVSLWEEKIGKTLEKEYVPEEQILRNIREAPIVLNFMLSITHSVYVKGDQTFYEIEPSFGVEASELYPDVKYTTVDEYLNQFV
ncbi:hypothetical protein MKW94_001583 [Papaver nudicaule]|uniref:NmrA-like domain-containing protein n=1 Tax=Papaver nudicaule TaxID=74823 RepID=A0AA41W0H9_PAPNU|nr:hypothetical protein [Papaver nudicaule]